jgi:hypothetical protein
MRAIYYSYACVETCVYEYEIPCCKNDTMIENGTSDYFERGKHSIGCHDNSNDPLDMLKYLILVPTVDVQ